MNKNRGKDLVKLPPGPAQRHGGFSYFSAGRLPRHRRYLLRYLTACRQGMIRDLGPTDQDLSTAQLILVDRAIGKLGLLRCIEEHVREHGVMAGHQLASALRGSYLSYSNSLRLDLQALGLHRKKTEEPLDLGRYLAQKDAEKVKDEAAGQASGEGVEGESAREDNAEGGGDE